jgi:hypothetical protein
MCLARTSNCRRAAGEELLAAVVTIDTDINTMQDSDRHLLGKRKKKAEDVRAIYPTASYDESIEKRFDCTEEENQEFECFPAFWSGLERWQNNRKVRIFPKSSPPPRDVVRMWPTGSVPVHHRESLLQRVPRFKEQSLQKPNLFWNELKFLSQIWPRLTDSLTHSKIRSKYVCS